MDANDILKIRLYNQLLAGTKLREPQEIVSYMVAMQSQTFDYAKWAIGTRLEGSTNDHIEKAINDGKIVRTHILRPTWHFVSAEDIHWMLDISSPRLRPSFLSYGKMLGVEDEFIFKGLRLLEKILENDNHLTRQEIITRFSAEGMDIDTHRANHILGYGEVEGIVGSGKVKANKHSYCLLQERIPKRDSLGKEEAIERLTRQFFVSHGPATLQDFIWWSGMLISDAKKALESIKGDFISEEINGRTFWMKNDIQIPDIMEESGLLLPQFDEFVVSYKDRSEIVEDEHYGKVMTKNGLFSNTIMHNGKIIGSWKKVTKNKKTDVELTFFNKTNKQLRDLYKKPVNQIKEFYNV